jgi:DnaJ-class molecular chaperone
MHELVVCPRCNGAGIVECPKCNGAGIYAACDHCERSGEVTCPLCDGKEEVPEPAFYSYFKEVSP